MRAILALAVIGVGVSATATASAAWTTNDLPGGCRDMSFVGATTGFAAVESGGAVSLYKTTTGSSWSKVAASGLPADTTSIVQIDATHGHACAGSAATTAADAIATTSDGGATWSARAITLLPATTGTNVALAKIAFGTKKHGVAVGTLDGARGFVAVTKDEGATWAEVAAPASKALGGVTMLSDKDIVIAGADDAGLVALWSSHDGGASFVGRYTGKAAVAGQPFPIDSAGGSTFFLRGCDSGVGNSACVLRSTDKGDTWAPPALTYFPGNYASIAFADADHGIVGGAVGVADVRVTSDGGKTWSAGATGGKGGPARCAAYPGPAAYVGASFMESLFDPALGGGPRPPIPGADVPDAGASSSSSSSSSSGGASSSSGSSGASSGGASSSSSSSGGASSTSSGGAAPSSGSDGGCSSAGGNATSPLAVGLVGLVGFLAARRRRR